MLVKYWIAVVMAMALTSCAHNSELKTDKTISEDAIADAAVNSQDQIVQSASANSASNTKNADISAVDRKLSGADLANLEGDTESPPLDVPEEINKKVADWINFFTVRDRARTERFLERGLALKPHIEKILRDNDMPEELFYLAMVESGFVTSAKSRAKAVGVWQFMKGTGRNYGLAVSPYIDERRNWIKSTEAAAGYLRDLNNVFGSWYLALSAYNAGENRIIRTIMKGKSRDFWALAEAGLLPRETMEYVPKFLAAMIVGKNLKKYGFNVTPDETWEEYTVVGVSSGVSLVNISSASGIPLSELQHWNRDLIKGITAPTRSGQAEIYIPKRFSDRWQLQADAIRRLQPSAKVHYYAKATSIGGEASYYVVRNGDSLNSIANKLGTSWRNILRLNGLSRTRIHVGQRLKYYRNESTTSRQIASYNKNHKVKPGESIKSIAKQHRMSVGELLKANGLGNQSKVTIGQRLVVK